MSFLGRTETVADGVQAAFPVSFPFQARTEVGIYVRPYGSFLIGAPKVVGVDFNWTSDGLITFIAGHIPLAGTTVVARRETLDTDLDNTVQPGGSLKSSQLVQNDRQLLYLSQEAKDGDADLQLQINSTNATVNDALTHPFIVNGANTDASDYPLPVLTPEQFEAYAVDLGGGIKDWGPALATMSMALQAAGGGTLFFDLGQTYWVGSQTANTATPNGVYRYAPDTLYPLEISGCTRGVLVIGNGACIKCLAGKKFGSFEADGTPSGSIQVLVTKAASPYFAMAYVHGNSGDVRGVLPELDGNIAAASLGGDFGDVGKQIPMSGLLIGPNSGSVDLYAHSHHHGLDGGFGDGYGLKTVKESVVVRGRYHNNGRNNFSLVGGNGWHFGHGVQLVQAGKGIGAMTYSPPGAGLDIEAEGGKWVLNTTMDTPFVDDNSGVGLLSDTNAFVEGFHVRGGKVIGSTNWSLWPNNPRFIFEDVLIVGSSVNHYHSTNPGLACKFIRGMITDDVLRSPSGVVYGGGAGTLLLDEGGGTQNILFDQVRFLKTKAGSSEQGVTGNFATNTGWRFHNCTFEKTNGNMVLYGIYSGDRTEIIEANMFPGPSAGAKSLFQAGPALDSFYFTNVALGLARARYQANVDQRTTGAVS